MDIQLPFGTRFVSARSVLGFIRMESDSVGPAADF